jgi:hypothetical protein
MTDDRTTHFGFETVPEGDKAGLRASFALPANMT